MFGFYFNIYITPRSYRTVTASQPRLSESNLFRRVNKQQYSTGVPNPGVFKKTDDKNVNSKNFYTLIWEVDSYTPIIEYSLWFRPYRPTKSALHKSTWTKLTIPTEHNTNTGPMYSKLYTIKGLKEKTVYEALLVSRNRYGWSKPSPILRFATIGAGNNIFVCPK